MELDRHTFSVGNENLRRKLLSIRSNRQMVPIDRRFVRWVLEVGKVEGYCNKSPVGHCQCKLCHRTLEQDCRMFAYDS